MGVLKRWQDTSRSVHVAAAAGVVVLTYGTGVHLVQLMASGLDPYPELPGSLRTYFVALTVLDPLAAVLLARHTRTGVTLAVTVLVTDAAANGWANYALDPVAGVTTGRITHAVITVLAIGACTAGPYLWRATARRQRHP